VEPEGSLPCSQEPATCPYREPDESNSHPPSFLQDPSTSRSSEFSPLRLPTKILYTFLISPYAKFWLENFKTRDHLGGVYMVDNKWILEKECLDMGSVVNTAMDLQVALVTRVKCLLII
jgi:hypothetical protein